MSLLQTLLFFAMHVYSLYVNTLDLEEPYARDTLLEHARQFRIILWRGRRRIFATSLATVEINSPSINVLQPAYLPCAVAACLISLTINLEVGRRLAG